MNRAATNTLIRIDSFFLYLHLSFILFTIGIGPASVVIFTLVEGIIENSIPEIIIGIIYTAHLIYSFIMGEKPSRQLK